MARTSPLTLQQLQRVRGIIETQIALCEFYLTFHRSETWLNRHRARRSERLLALAAVNADILRYVPVQE